MTGSNGDRLELRLSAVEERMERVEQSLDRASAMIELLVQAQTRTQQVVDSNARAVQAWETRVNQVEEDGAEERSRLRVDLSAVQATLDRTTELQQTLLQVQLRDREEWRQQREEWQQQRSEINQQIQALIDLSRQNTQAHNEFRTDIRRIWERLDR